MQQYRNEGTSVHQIYCGYENFKDLRGMPLIL